ncbi:MAG: hypothetical protein E7279_01315 [Lachnospiraceae bacterium]|nr:hypothetical protein [Lachnospiraceae bacterium]
MKNKNFFKKIKRISAKKAYQLTEPHICDNVWNKINDSISCGRICAHINGSEGKVPLHLIKELIELGYSIEVSEFCFDIAPTLSIYFNKEAKGELLIKKGDSFESKKVPLSYEDYENLGKRK